MGIKTDKCCYAAQKEAHLVTHHTIGTNDLVYNDLKNALVERFTGEDYKRKLEKNYEI